MKPEDWLVTNEHLLGSPYEKLFVIKVLSPIRDLDLSAVQPQFSFKDADGKQRYCDFVLIEGDDVRIAIEVDGYDKRGTGSGMSRDDFLDWQRRQAALTAQGWFVLRFANTDVRDQPQRCREHIELLLRRERRRQQHQDSLANSINKLTAKLQTMELARDLQDADTEKHRLREELQVLKQQLKYAAEARPLDSQEQALLEKFQAAQEHIKVLKSENSVMKTTIWAFTAIIAVMIITFAVKFDGTSSSPVTATNQTQTIQAQPAVHHVAPSANDTVAASQQANVVLGSSCATPVDWRDSNRYVGKQVAIAGPIMRVTHRQDVQGKPTWIEVGAAFPSSQRVTLVIWGDNRSAFEPRISQPLSGKQICVIGRVELYRDTTQIELTDTEQILFF